MQVLKLFLIAPQSAAAVPAEIHRPHPQPPHRPKPGSPTHRGHRKANTFQTMTIFRELVLYDTSSKELHILQNVEPSGTPNYERLKKKIDFKLQTGSRESQRRMTETNNQVVDMSKVISLPVVSVNSGPTRPTRPTHPAPVGVCVCVCVHTNASTYVQVSGQCLGSVR